MSLNDTPSANRIHIGFFGRRNAGKSSLVNAVTAQDLAVVSDRPGTTTDPVQKAMELLPLGPVDMTDTPGFDGRRAGARQQARAAHEARFKQDRHCRSRRRRHKGYGRFRYGASGAVPRKGDSASGRFQQGRPDAHRAPRASCASARRPERASKRSKTASARSRQKKTAGSCWQTSSARTRWSYWSRRLTNPRRRGA